MTAEAAIVAAVDARGRVLCVLQRGGVYAGHWLLPGGRLERGEDARGALARELREETGCRLRSAREVALYRVRVNEEEWRLRMFTGVAAGMPRAEAGSDVTWLDPGAHPMHPSLRRELADLGLRREANAQIARDLARAGIAMERLR